MLLLLLLPCLELHSFVSEKGRHIKRLLDRGKKGFQHWMVDDGGDRNEEEW